MLSTRTLSIIVMITESAYYGESVNRVVSSEKSSPLFTLLKYNVRETLGIYSESGFRVRLFGLRRAFVLFSRLRSYNANDQIILIAENWLHSRDLLENVSG